MKSLLTEIGLQIIYILSRFVNGGAWVRAIICENRVSGPI